MKLIALIFLASSFGASAFISSTVKRTAAQSSWKLNSSLPAGSTYRGARSSATEKKDMWSQLNQVTKNKLKESGRVIFNLNELERDHSGLAAQLQEETSLDFQVPKTTKEAVITMLHLPSIQLALVALVGSVCMRLSLGPLGLADVATVAGTRIFWELQEWIVHAHLFHGNKEDQATMMPFEDHDRHHNLPYYYVTINPLAQVICWFLAVALAAGVAVGFGAPTTLVLAAASAYTSYGIGYMVIHFLTHTKLPLKGWLQEARANHISHHLKPGIYLNMGPNRVDQIFQTVD